MKSLYVCPRMLPAQTFQHAPCTASAQHTCLCGPAMGSGAASTSPARCLSAVSCSCCSLRSAHPEPHCARVSNGWLHASQLPNLMYMCQLAHDARTGRLSSAPRNMQRRLHAHGCVKLLSSLLHVACCLRLACLRCTNSTEVECTPGAHAPLWHQLAVHRWLHSCEDCQQLSIQSAHLDVNVTQQQLYLRTASQVAFRRAFSISHRQCLQLACTERYSWNVLKELSL